MGTAVNSLCHGPAIALLSLCHRTAIAVPCETWGYWLILPIFGIPAAVAWRVITR